MTSLDDSLAAEDAAHSPWGNAGGESMALRRGDHRGRTGAVVAHALGGDGNDDPGKPELGQGGQIALGDARVTSPIGATKRRHRCRSFPTPIALRGGDPCEPRVARRRPIIVPAGPIVHVPRWFARGNTALSVPKITNG